MAAWPIVLGHEGAGVVEAVGADVERPVPGDHVVFCFVPPCGACDACRAGRPTLCEPAGASSVAGTLLDGTSRLRAADGTVLQHGLMVACFAEYVVVPSGSAIPIPDDVPLWQAALLGCAVSPASAPSPTPLRCGVGDRVCVIGCGGVGLQVIAGARLAGATTIIAVDQRPGQARARAAPWGDARGRRDRIDPAAEIRELAGGGVDYAFEVVGVAGDDPHGLGLAATGRHGGGRRAGAGGRRGEVAGDRVPVREGDQGQLLRLGGSPRDAARGWSSSSARGGSSSATWSRI